MVAQTVATKEQWKAVWMADLWAVKMASSTAAYWAAYSVEMTAVHWDKYWVASKVERSVVLKDATRAVRLAVHWAAHLELQKAVLMADAKVASMALKMAGLMVVQMAAYWDDSTADGTVAPTVVPSVL